MRAGEGKGRERNERVKRGRVEMTRSRKHSQQRGMSCH
jgi:hypothetical protein